MSSLIKKRIGDKIYLYDVQYIKSKRKHKWRCLGRLDENGVLISNKRKLPSQIKEVKRITRKFIIT